MLLRPHAIIRTKEPPPERNQLSLGRMIERFHPRDALGELSVFLVDVLHKLILCTCRSCDEDRSRQLQFIFFQEIAVNTDVATITGIRLVMQMLVTARAAHERTHHLIV
jgi:hypothetical protein